MSKTSLIILIVALVILAILAIILTIYILHKKKVRDSNRKADEIVHDSAIKVSDKFGGSENIVEVSYKGSRVVVLVKDPTLVDKKSISETLEQVMFMGNKVVFVIGSKSEYFKQLLEENIDKKSD